MRVFIKILLIVGLSVAIYADNVDQKKFYDANRDNNEKLEKMSQELQLFIDSTASEELIKEYQEAIVELTEDEKEAQQEALEDAQDEAQDQASEQQEAQAEKVDENEPGFFTRMLAKIGIGSTKKLPVEEQTETKDKE